MTIVEINNHYRWGWEECQAINDALKLGGAGKRLVANGTADSNKDLVGGLMEFYIIKEDALSVGQKKRKDR